MNADEVAREIDARFGAFLRDRVNREAAQRDRERRPLDAAVFREAAEIGLWGFATPAAWGGGGRDVETWALALERVSFLCEDMAFVALLATTRHFAESMFARDDERLVERYARPMLRGERIGALALYEEDREPTELASTARRVGPSWVLSGRKSMITGGMLADPFVVFVRDEASDDVLVFLVEPADPGVSRAPVDTLGARSAGLAALTLDEVTLGDDRLLCAADGLGYLETFFAKRRWEEAAILVGSMQAILERCIVAMRARTRGGRPMLELPNVQAEIGRIVSGIETSRALLHSVVGSGDGAKGVLAKHHATEKAIETALAIVRLQGAFGYMEAQPWERYLRDALAMLSAAGHQDTLLRAIGEQAVIELEMRMLRQRA